MGENLHTRKPHCWGEPERVPHLLVWLARPSHLPEAQKGRDGLSAVMISDFMF